MPSEEIAMRVFARLCLVSALVVGLCGLKGSLAQERETQRIFRLDWVSGECRRCGADFDLGQIEFLSTLDGWAIGEQMPVAGNGLGVSTILFTTDGGTTWRRLPWVWQQDAEAPPAFWFVDQAHGCVSWLDESVVHRLSCTSNAGRSWRKLTDPPGQRFVTLRFFDSKSGVSTGVRLNAKPFFASTNDGGQSWQVKDLPIRSVDQAWFFDREVGYLVGKVLTDGPQERLAVLRSYDGGANWMSSLVAETPYEFAQDFDWSDKLNGWLIAWLTDRGGSHLYLTKDGGRTWQRNRDEPFEGRDRYMRAIRFITKQYGYAFLDNTQTNEHYILSTTDGGKSWQQAPLKKSVSSCQVFAGELWCSAGMDLLRLRPTESEHSRGLH